MPDAADDFIAKIRARSGGTAVEQDPVVDDFIAKVRVRRGDPVGMGDVRAAMFGDAGTESALPLSEDDKAAYIKRLFQGQDYDPGSEVLSPEEQQRIFADYKREPYVVGAGGADPEFTRRTAVAAFDKLFGPRTVGDRQQIEEILAKHAPKEASVGERAQYLGGQFMEGMNAPAMGYARRLFGRGGALENPASLEAAENVANPSRKSIGDGRFEEVRKDVESTFVGRTLSGAAHLAGATPGLLATGAALTKPTVSMLNLPNAIPRVIPALAAGPTALGLNSLASSGGDVAAAGEGVAFGAIAGALSIPLKQYIASLPIALQSKAVDRLATMAAGGLEFAAADAILHGPDGERALTNFIFGAGMKSVGTSPGQARAKELTTSRATYPDPVEAARGVREGYDRRLAEVESARPSTPAIDPVAEAKATAAEFDARPAPGPTAPEKPVSVAPVASVEVPASAPKAKSASALPGVDPADVAMVRSAVEELSRRVNRFEAQSVKVNVENFLMVGAKAGFINELRNSEILTRDLEGAINRMSAAKIAEIEAKRRPAPAPPEAAPVAPDAPASKTLVGTDKRGREVWEVRGKFYVRDTGGRLGTAHPQEVAEAKASAQASAPVEAAPESGLSLDVGPSDKPMSQSFKAWQSVFQETLSKTGDLNAAFKEAESRHPGDYRPAMTDSAARAMLAEKNAKTDAMVDGMVDMARRVGNEKDASYWEGQREVYREKNRQDVESKIRDQEADATLARDLRRLEATHGYLSQELPKAKVQMQGAVENFGDALREYSQRKGIPAPEARPMDAAPAEAKSTYGSKNTVVTKENYEAAKAALKAKLGQTRLNSNIDPTILADLVRIGAYHLESGVRDFASWARVMLQDYGDAIRPHLRSVWEDSQKMGAAVGRRPDEAPAPRPGKQAEAPPKPADVVRELTAPPAETSMFAGGPESISTKAYEAWTATREGFRGAIRGLKDFFSSQKAPELLRLSPRAWRGVVAAESAPQIAKAAVKVWEAEVPNPSWSPKERVQFEAALTENNRLGAVDNRIADAEAKRTEAQALREQAATLNKSAAADALLKKATRLDREALVFDERAKRAEGKNEYLIGEGKPFASQAELAEFVSRPDVVEAAKRHQAWWSEMVEPSYKSAQSIEGTEPMPTRGRFFDSRASLVVPPEGEATTGVAGTKAGQTENIKTRRSKFAHLAWGDSSRGYEVEANKYLKKALEDVVPKGGWREAVDSLVREGHGVRLTKPDQKPPTEIAGEPAMKFDIGQQGERVYLPKSLHETLTHIRQVGAATHIKGFTSLANTSTHQAMSMAKDNIFVMARAISRVMTLPSTGRPALEIAGNVALWPVMRVIDIAKLTTKALGYMRASPRDRLEMARAGVAEREPMLKRDSKGRVETDAQGNPIEVDANLPGLKWLGPVSNAIDTAARESLVTTMRRLKANGVNIDTSPAAMSKYVGQLGRYGRAWYGAVQRFFTDAGINPFFESRRTSRGNALRTMAANPNLTPLDTGTALKLRGVVLSKLVGLMTTTAIANVLTTGDALGGPSTPIGAISLGKDKDGKRIFFDFWKLMGIRQVARATGIEQALEGLRRGDDAGQVAVSALTGAGREAAGFVSGPLPTALSIGATGSRPDQLIGGQTDASIPAAVDPITLARRRAVEGAKAALPLVGEGAELFAKWFGGENIKDILNAGTEVTPDMIDEFVNLRNTVGVGVGQTDAQASTLHDRSNKGFFFGTYLDAVKEDLRRASPDKVQAIVDKAWRDIDTRDDLSAGDKKKAKSAIQYYARNRRLLMGGK